jgi:hypothetical protein
MAIFGLVMHKSVHELWGGKITIFELPPGLARDENSRDRGRAEAVFLDRSRETERVACSMARSDQKVSSKRGGLRWGSRSWELRGAG